MRLEDLTAYEILEKRPSEDLGSTAIRLRHKKTGAKVALLSNNDDNKVFYIGFRTPPKDSTGVAHITEHSVLCGSKDFPVKDPFVELVKGSLNTFLNAMTYPDKTVYPVASCNAQDFQNLMHVYLDAVFYPNTYTNEAIFRQEGWHYEFDDEGKLFINGVVYNEMKGAFSSPDDVLEREIMNSLYPTTSYGVESGGDPENIPDLTYEEFLDFHRAYYHPSNSYIYLYGDMDMAEKLDYIDREYLSKFDRREVDSEIQIQEPFSEPVRLVRDCPLNEGEDAGENTFLSVNYSLGSAIDSKQYLAFQVLDYALCSVPGAPLKQALVERGLGNDVYSIYENGIRQPFFSVVAKDTKTENEEAFLATVQEILTEQATKGIDKNALRAAINYFEFQYREADFGRYPKGLMYGLQALDSWLYDGEVPFLFVEQNGIFADLKDSVDTGYFESLVKDKLLNNPHRSVVVLNPVEGLQEKKDRALADRLAELQASLSEEEIQKIKDDFAVLQEFQEREDSKEDLARIPLLSREDLNPEILPLCNEELQAADRLLLYHELPTNGIAYVRLLFSMDKLPGEYYPYAALLKGILGQVDTDAHKYADLNNQLNLVTGGFGMSAGGYTNLTDINQYSFICEAKVKYLYSHAAEAFSLIREILFTSHLEDTKRLGEILAEMRSQLQAGMTGSAHSVATVRAGGHISPDGRISDEIAGISFYHFIADLNDHFEEKKDELVSKLQQTAKMLFRRENLVTDLTAESCAVEAVKKEVELLAKELYTEEVPTEKYVPAVYEGSEGFMTAGQVLYVCRSGNYRRTSDNSLDYTGALRVLRVIMGYQYLWVNVRVKGGAYGCMSNFGRSGNCFFVSYRDPNLSKTIQVFEDAPAAIREFEADERTMTQFIIGAISEVDQPMNPAAKGARSATAYLTGLTEEMLRKGRAEILNCTPADIKACAEQLQGFLDSKVLVTIGNAAKIKEEEKLFTRVENMF